MVEFFGYGEYGAYIWSAYGVTAILLIALCLQSWASARERVRQANALKEKARMPQSATRRPIVAARERKPDEMEGSRG